MTDSWLDSDPEDFDPSLLPAHVLNAIEADSFWCLSRLLDGIQDNYIFAQPGIQRSVRRMAELVGRIDGTPFYLYGISVADLICMQPLYQRIWSPRMSNSCSLHSGG
jgi:Rab-GTPase-TBC domain